MNTFKTINEARTYANIKNIATHIVEIEPGKDGVFPYLCLTCNAETFTKVLKRKPMTEIKKVIRDVVNLEKEKFELKETKKEKNIPGLKELENIISDWNYYQESFNRMMEDEMNDGVHSPKRPTKEVADIAKQYPIASAYIKTDNWSMADNYVKSGAGSKAKKAIENGEDYKIAIEKMEQEWNEYCDKNKWN